MDFFYALYGHNSPTFNYKNPLFERFETITAPKKFCDFFMILKKLNDSSKKTEDCLNYLSLFVCCVFRGLKPPVFCGALFSHCDELRKVPSLPFFLIKVDFPRHAKDVWNTMKQPAEVLNEWKCSGNK